MGYGPFDRPDGGVLADTQRLDDLRAVHEPDRNVPAGVAPENVAHGVAVEVSCADNRPYGRDIYGPGGRELRVALEREPDRYIATGVAPENVALAVAAEVAGSDDLPAGSGRATTPRRRTLLAV